MIKAAMRNYLFICLVIFSFCLSVAADVAGERNVLAEVWASTHLTGEQYIPKPFINLGQEDQDYALLVDKSLQRLDLYAAAEIPRLLRVYHATTGRQPGDKKRRGDQRTPEGVYFFNAMYDKHQLHPRYGLRAFVMDYPNFLDRREGKNGGGIWLHATNPSKGDRKKYNSRGCVVVSNKNIMELSPYITLKDTPIVIVDKIKYFPLSEARRYDREIMAMLSKWKSDWENKRLDDYLSHYCSNFFTRGMNKYRWRKYKDWLNKKYASIDVKIENLKILRHDGIVVASFRQYYQSDKHADVGLKKLFLTRERGLWKILTEEWTELTAAELKTRRSSQKHRAGQ
jgi:murein L,D-transpeptidase YafK